MVLEIKVFAKGCLLFWACFHGFGLPLACQYQAMLEGDNGNESLFLSRSSSYCSLTTWVWLLLG